MKFGVAIRKNETDYFVHQSYLYLLKKYGHTYDFLTLETNLNAFDAFLLPGGYDIDPLHYNQENYASHHIDYEMDMLDKKIICYAYQTKKPLLGICRGIQSINVFLGGTLKQDIAHHMNENHFIYMNNHYVLVNSFHHQSIDKLAPDLEAIGTSLDGEIEVIKHKSLPIYGVQFHPELFSFDLSFFFNEL
ncbi:MAG: gamma-glutamyl-gamma-aminobutyrate hydrolase family protein [Anaeroplasmataceae bacterium]|nr:gamma-glutamyl-gamma-aminobutyrate hydrolase family protein [Anaeroplasmataceae bacterium]MDE6414403.1 gamma-glutamyl-gamma-aminobutyrate hydrolase family protein [Anaeroplasmataceae bacterium]